MLLCINLDISIDTWLFVILGRNLDISAKYNSGNLLFKWHSSFHTSYYDVLIDMERETNKTWTRVNETQFTLSDVWINETVTINVRRPGKNVDNKMTFNGT